MRLDRAPMTALAVTFASAMLAGAPRFEARFVLPPQDQHVAFDAAWVAGTPGTTPR